MFQAENTLYWFTPFFNRNDLDHFYNHNRMGKCTAFFCFDSQWNKVSIEDLQFLKSELEKHGIKLILMEGQIEKTVPSVARVLKTGWVVCAKPDNHQEFEPVIKRICRDLALHSIAFCDHPSQNYSFYNEGDHPGIRHAV